MMFSRILIRLMLALAAVTVSGCSLPPPSPSATIIPGYEFMIGTNRNDIESVLGYPNAGLRMDRLTNLVEAVYSLPFDGFTVDTRLPDGTMRSETADRIFLFYDSRGRLVSMTHRPDRNYPVFTTMPVDRVRVAPRIQTSDGMLLPAPQAR